MLALIDKSKVSTPEQEIYLAKRYVAGQTDVYRQVDNWINQVTRLSIWHFVEETEDTNSVVHLKLFSSLKASKFRGESTFRTYVQRIARYTCIDQVRSQRVQRDADPEDLPVPSESEAPDIIHERSVEYQIFQKIFRSIDPECQKLWRMVFSESLNYKEIGGKLGLPEGTVKRKVHECKKTAMEMKEKLI
ncbi:MAG: sigma-70 family RNA polymerase sigma factor [bacterium]|nr:sigma-70 family RNA polymerase sigma factor [bacterium]